MNNDVVKKLNDRINKNLKYEENELKSLKIKRLFFPFFAIVLYFLCVVLSTNIFLMFISSVLLVILIANAKTENFMNELNELNVEKRKRALFLSEQNKKCELYVNSILAIPRNLRNIDLSAMEDIYKEGELIK